MKTVVFRMILLFKVKLINCINIDVPTCADILVLKVYIYIYIYKLNYMNIFIDLNIHMYIFK